MIELARDFEAIAHLHGHRHKPERASDWFAYATSAADAPPELALAIERVVALGRTR